MQVLGFGGWGVRLKVIQGLEISIWVWSRVGCLGLRGIVVVRLDASVIFPVQCFGCRPDCAKLKGCTM